MAAKENGEEMVERDVDMESDSESSDSNASAEDISDDDAETEQKINELVAQVEASPYTYDLHLELISFLRNQGELERLRSARERMSVVFPLTEKLWLEWLKDEVPLATSGAAERARINTLFDTAVKDYLSVDIWLEYVQYSIGGMSLDGGLEHIRGVFERALTAVGLHVAKGSHIWEAYREFEMAILGGLQPVPGSVATKETQEKIDNQIKKIDSLFRRQLAIPLIDMASTWTEYTDFIDSVDKYVEQTYKKAEAKLTQLMPYEHALDLNVNTPSLDDFDKYIEHEMKEGGPARIQCVYERAITVHCLKPDLWLRYLTYLDTDLRVATVILSAYERAARNCPWSVGIWQGYLLAGERHHKPHDQMNEIFTKSLQGGFTECTDYVQLWKSRLDYLRRRVDWTQDGGGEKLEKLRETFEGAIQYIQEAFGKDGDPTCSLHQYHAWIEAKYCKNMEKARVVWNGIMTLGHGSEAQMWIDFSNLERSFGDHKHCRRVFQRGLNSANDWPELVCDAFLKFEREEGTLEQYDQAVIKCEAQLDRIKERRRKAAEREEVEKVAKKKDKQKQKVAKYQEKQSNKQNKQAKTVTSPPKDEQAKPKEAAVQPETKAPPPGFKKPPPPGYKGPPQGKKAAPPPGFKVPPPPGFNKDEPPTKRHKGDSDVKIPDSATPNVAAENETPSTAESGTSDDQYKHSDHNKDLTAFVSNLGYKVDEDRLRQEFNKVGEITEVRLVKNFKGQSKGFAYVEFSQFHMVAEALKLDRNLLDGRPMYVSPFQTKDAKPQFRHSTGLEKRKLFIRGLPFTTTKEALETIFKQHGIIRDVRLVTHKSGASKGLAYVEFEDESDATQAILKTDGLQIGDKTISVAISNPPPRKTPLKDRDAFTPSLGGGKKQHEYRKAHTQVAFMPRSVHKPSTKSAQSATSAAQSGSTAATSDSQANAASLTTPDSNNATTKATTGMSNADFRTMLMKK